MNQLQSYQNGGPYDDPYGGPPPVQHSDRKEQLERMIDILHRGKWIIVGVFVIFLVLSFLYVHLQEPSYRSSSLVMLAGSGQNQSRSADELVGPVTSRVQWGRSVQSELLLVRNSEELPRDVARRLMRLPDHYDSQLRPLILGTEGDSLSEEQVARRVRGRVEFGASGDGLLEFRAVTSSPPNAPLLANLFAEEYVELARRMSRSSLAASRHFLNEQVAKQEAKLDSIDQRIEGYLQRQGAVSIESQGSQLVSQMGQLETRRDEIEIELERRQASLRALRNTLEQIRPRLASSLASTASQELELVQQKLAEKKAERQVALLNNPEWEGEESPPQLRRINRQIQILEDKANELSEEYVAQVVRSGSAGSDTSASTDGLAQAASLEQRIASQQISIAELRAERDAIEEQVERYRSELQSVPGESIRIEKLRRDRERVASMHDYITQRLQEIRIRMEGEQGYASVAAKANSIQSVQTSKKRTLILGALFGLALGIGLVVLRSKFDNRIFKPDQLEEQGYNATIVPDMSGMLKADYGGKRYVRINGDKVPTSLVTLHKKASPSTEAYRQLRTNLQYNWDGSRSNIVAITSPGIGEGKSTTSANLAVAFAKSGRRTLLLDVDMRRPQIHKFMGRSLEPGLFQILQEGMPFDPARLETRTDNLFVITAGRTAGGSASELLDSPRMGELLSFLRDNFDVIVVDTPPVLAVSEAKQMAPRADATLMVVRAGETRESDLEQAVKELERVGGRTIGVVLNGFNLDMAYGYRYRYSSYSQEGHYTEYTEVK